MPEIIRWKRNYLEFVENMHAMHFEDKKLFNTELVESWLDFNSADSWRHQRAFEPVEIINNCEIGTWLTIGDGRLGLDSIRIRNLGVKDVTPTDISEELLRRAKIMGLIKNYRIENAEKLSFSDESFDFIFCKESLHHLPRPYLAIYEMLRVAKKAVVFVEPNDLFSVQQKGLDNGEKSNIFRKISKMRKKKYQFRIVFNPPSWEPSGNYTYAISVRDIVRLTFGMNLTSYVWKGLNDHYIEGCEYEPADASKSEIFREIQSVVSNKDLLCESGASNPDLVMHVLVKESFKKLNLEFFERNNWNVEEILPNPYFSERTSKH